MLAAEDLRERLAKVEARDGRRIFPMELRLEALAYANQQVSEGKPLKGVARELGLVGCTLGRWRQVERGATRNQTRAAFVEVSMPETKGQTPAEGRQLFVKCPSGHEVAVSCGFDGGTLKQLLRALEEI